MKQPRLGSEGSDDVAGGAASADPQSRAASTDLIRVGAIGLGDNSHLNYSIWAPMINPTEPGKWPSGRASRMLITHCWDSRPDVGEAFASRYRCVAVKNYYDMVGRVDAMQRLFENRAMPCSYDQILVKTNVFLAAFKSHPD